MYLLGVCNPKGENSTYNGLYFKQSELEDLVTKRELCGIPVKAEHSGSDVGSIVSAYVDADERLNCVIQIPEKTFQQCLVANLVRDRVALDLSMGYTVEVQHASDPSGYKQSKLHARTKKTLEVSLVRKGARHGCHIFAYEDKDGNIMWPKIKKIETQRHNNQRNNSKDWDNFVKNF